MPSTDELLTCRDLCVGFLRTVADQDWSTPVPDLDFDVAHLCAHISQTGFWYAIDLSARGIDLTNVIPEVNAASSPDDLITSVHVGMHLLAATITAAPADVRGFHPLGQADGSGFAAMACDEILIHTHDLSRAFALDFAPPAELAASVLARLFPWVDGDEDPWSLLQWANGRLSLPDRPQLDRWRWHCAPLSEWDGAAPDN